MKAPPWRHKPKNQTTRAHGRGHERERLSGLPKPPRFTPLWLRDGRIYRDEGEQAEGEQAKDDAVERRR